MRPRDDTWHEPAPPAPAARRGAISMLPVFVAGAAAIFATGFVSGAAWGGLFGPPMVIEAVHHPVGEIAP